VEGQAVIATYTTKDRGSETPIKPKEISGCPSPEPEISVGFIGLSVTQSLVVYVAITACPSTDPEISFGFIGVSDPGSGEGQAVIATYTTKD
jgi:hypothetical protein